MKFNIGDKVVVNSKSLQILKGLTGIVKRLNENNCDYIVDLENHPFRYSSSGPIEVGFNESELDIFIRPLSNNSYGVFGSSQQITPITGNINIAQNPIENYIGVDLAKDITIVSNTHSCTFKTYTGLFYKEEYCDCGATKNRRGIYE